MNKFKVGSHRLIKEFDCLDCATIFYNELKEDKKYLMDICKNEIIKNSYGWKNGN